MTPKDHQPVERMKLARQVAGLSQEEAAHRLGVTTRTYARWERGETAGWLSQVERIAEAFGVDPEEISPPPPDGDRLSELEGQVTLVREMIEGIRDMLLDPEKLATAGRALADEPAPRRPRKRTAR